MKDLPDALNASDGVDVIRSAVRVLQRVRDESWVADAVPKAKCQPGSVPLHQGWERGLVASELPAAELVSLREFASWSP